MTELSDRKIRQMYISRLLEEVNEIERLNEISIPNIVEQLRLYGLNKIEIKRWNLDDIIENVEKNKSYFKLIKQN